MLDYRYVRNVLVGEIGEAGQKKLNESKVLLLGVGGLGSSVAYNLACLGVETLGLVDYDKVELTNLNRQYLHGDESIDEAKVESAKRSLLRLNNKLNIHTHNFVFGADTSMELLKGYDVVVDCLDNFGAKFALNRACVMANVPLVHAGVEGLCGQVMTIVPKVSACLDCILQESDEHMVNKAIVAPTVNVLGSIASWETAKILLGEDNLLTGKFAKVDLRDYTVKHFNVRRNPNCKTCA